MAGRTPIPVWRAMRQVAAHLDLARRQQRITMELLAERANLSVPTVRKLLSEGRVRSRTFCVSPASWACLTASWGQRIPYARPLVGRERNRTYPSA